MSKLPFKDALLDRIQEIGAGTSEAEMSEPVPSDEIWEVTNIYVEHNAAAGEISMEVKDLATFHKVTPTVKYASWQGHIWLVEGQKIKCTSPSCSNLYLTVLGKKHIPIPWSERIIEEDLQEPEVVVDPRM